MFRFLEYQKYKIIGGKESGILRLHGSVTKENRYL